MSREIAPGKPLIWVTSLMPALDFLLHFTTFMAPAFAVAGVLAVFSRLYWGGDVQMLVWWRSWLLNALLGVLVLALGLVLGGQDGKMTTYLVLVLALSSTQWLLSHGWRR